MKDSFKESDVKSQVFRFEDNDENGKTMTTSTDKLLDYMFAQNSKLTDQLAGVREELRLQREQADRNHKDLKSSLAWMEERAVAAEKRADMEALARAKAEEQIVELMALCRRLKNQDSSLNDKNENR